MSRLRSLILPHLLGLTLLGGASVSHAQVVVENAVYAVDQAMRDYNLIALGNASLSSFSSTHGKLAVKGDLTLTNGGTGVIGDQVANYAANTNPVLYVNGNLTINGQNGMQVRGQASTPELGAGWTWNGSTLTGPSGSLQLTNVNNPSNPLNSSTAPQGWDWLSAKTTFETASATLGAATATGTISVSSGGNLVFTTEKTSGVAVFTLDMANFNGSSFNNGASGWSELKNVQVNVPDDVTYVVNIINATDTAIFGGQNMNGNQGANNDQLLWNITPTNNPGLTSGTISLGSNNNAFFGSVLAPELNVSNNGSRMTGQIVSKDYTHSSVQLHYISFDSTVSFSPVPEPNAWGLSAMATAFLAILRRPRRSSAPLAA